MRLLAEEAANIHVTFLLNHEGTKVTKNDSSGGTLKDTHPGRWPEPRIRIEQEKTEETERRTIPLFSLCSPVESPREETDRRDCAFVRANLLLRSARVSLGNLGAPTRNERFATQLTSPLNLALLLLRVLRALVVQRTHCFHQHASNPSCAQPLDPILPRGRELSGLGDRIPGLPSVVGARVRPRRIDTAR